MIDKEEILDILQKLRKAFPKTFPKKSFFILKKGIDLDICRSGAFTINRTRLRRFLAIYTGHPGYVKAHQVGEKRYDLDGNAVGEITNDEASAFTKVEKARIKRRRFIRKQKKKEVSEKADLDSNNN